ncbi:DUF6278 family protein [Streptomyces sp. NPDC046985]|uniref:DUF6278 family protein n=1 Tax=Streptomyces sp. NPDC046985 TaxID=3155377 RepID=UPI0033EA84E6
MKIPFVSDWRKKRAPALGFAVLSAGDEVPDPDGLADLLSSCELLRVQASQADVPLDESEASLEALDQLLPSWRDDVEKMSWLGNDAGLYLGTVIVRTVPGAVWEVWPNGHPIVRLSSGREFDVVAYGHAWADSGAPGLSQRYAEISET